MAYLVSVVSIMIIISLNIKSYECQAVATALCPCLVPITSVESYIPNGGSYAQGDAQALHIGEDGLEATQAARRQNMNAQSNVSQRRQNMNAQSQVSQRRQNMNVQADVSQSG